ncbi:MAG: GIY-YIG nuclease family protein [Lentisphaerae bacterium]|nr:GIY-YIG nuclease family protein [Lentisphaerota bacterium]
MNLFDILNLKAPDIKPEECKLHLAGWDGSEDPIDVFLSGEFEEWQSWQSKKNFERKYIISIIQLPAKDKWLFAGGYLSHSCDYDKTAGCYKYRTEAMDEFIEFSGRLTVSFDRAARQSYLYAEKYIEKIVISELTSKKMAIEEFKGYNKFILTKKKLDIVVSQNIDSWRGALSNVAGVYLITDTATGRVYVGSATGDCGIWQRWSEYSRNGHGGNKELVALLKEKGDNYSNNFQYSILEIADTHSSSDDVKERESYWKDVLCSRKYGYNKN